MSENNDINLDFVVVETNDPPTQPKNQTILVNPESVRIQTQEIIRMRNAARKAHGNIKDMTVEDRTRRIVEIHAAVTKMKVFLQEMITIEGEVTEDLDEVEKTRIRKLDREYKSTRGLTEKEKTTKKEAKDSIAALSKQAGLDVNDIIKRITIAKAAMINEKKGH